MRLRTKLGLKILEARIWLVRKRIDWTAYPLVDPDLLGEPDAKIKAQVDKIFDSIRMN